MKLLLINPLDRNTCAYSKHFSPLSLAYIAALTPTEWTVELIDENCKAFVPLKADLVAISAMTIQINRAYEICRIYERMGVPVVMGGIHVSMLPKEALDYATSVVIGEAESLWQKVLDDFVNGKLERVYESNSYPPLKNMVVPRRDIFGKKYVFDSIQTSRGCPFDCDFCSVPVFNGRKYRVRPIDEVVEELKQIRKKFVFFVDDNIVGYGTANEERAAELFEEIIRSGVKKLWVSQGSINVYKNDELLKLMKRSGCLGILVGFESIEVKNLQKSGKTQNLINGQIPEKLYSDVIKKLHRYGVAVNGYFCYGYEDTHESILNSLQFILKSPVDIVNTPIVIPSPGTTLYKKLYNKIQFRNYPADWSNYLGQLVYRPRRISRKEFYKAYIVAAKRINSFREIFKRSFHSLVWSKNPFFALGVLMFNLGYRKLRKKGLSFLLHEDFHFKLAHDELKKR